jgi:glucose-1-phosphate thymidylyltransferase
MSSKEKKLHFVALGGGFGTRLNEIGKETPKGLLAAGKANTIIGRLMDDVQKETRIDELALVSNGRFFDKYFIWLQEKNYPKKVNLLNNGSQNPEERLGAIGDLFFLVKALNWRRHDVLVAPSDTLYGFGMSEFLDFCEGKEGLITIVRKMKSKAEIAGRLGCAQLSGDRMIGFEEKPQKPKSLFASIPFYLYREGTLQVLQELLNESGFIDAPGSVIPDLLRRGVSIYAYQTTHPTLDVGTPKDVPAAAHFYSSVDLE